MADEPQQPVQVVVQQADSGAVVDRRIVTAVRAIGGLSPAAMNNVVLFLALAMLALLIYIDRRDRNEAAARDRQDRTEQIQLILRSNESQSELNRQSIVTLSAQIGRLEKVVTALDRTVGNLPKCNRPPDEDEPVSVAPMPRAKVGMP